MFFKNLFRFLWYSLVICVASIFLSWIVCLVYEPMSPLYWYLAGVVSGVIVGGIFTILLTPQAAEDDNDCHERKTVTVILPLLFILLIAGASTLCFIIYRDTLTALLLIETYHTDFGVLTTVLGVYSVFPIIFFVVLTSSYSKYMCLKCGHIFCVNKDHLGTAESNHTEYKTETNREKVGEITSGSTKIADVYGNVDSSYYRNVKTTTSKYKCRCIVCGAKWRAEEKSVIKGDWK